MSDLIRLLPDHIANQIAAGEVIQRPASVVKELMENAIDSGATKIDVVIKDAGKALIQIVDNGCGMSAKDAVLCFERHATSKVQSAEDLFALKTKGFRGEALASVAAIAQVVLKTRTEASEVGNQVIIEGSKIKETSEVVTPKGTIFEVRNLFFNVPARRNFLKSERIEFTHITEEFERIALAHPEIQFSLQHDDQEVYNLPPAVLRKRIVDLLGRQANDRLVPIEEHTDIVTLSGFILKPEHARKSRGEQYFFVNDRYFRSSYFNHSVVKAFEGLLRENTHPGYFLFLRVDPAKIDVNVHPTKTEIKFEEERSIYSIMLSSVREALGKYNIAPTLDFERESSFDLPQHMKNAPFIAPEITVNQSYNPFRSTNSGNVSKENHYSQAIKRASGFDDTGSGQKDWSDFYTIEEEKSGEQERLFDESVQNEPKQFIHRSPFLISAVNSGMLFIHVNRAFERIIYDNLNRSFIVNPISSQQLLFPIEIELNKQAAALWRENTTLLKQLGFAGDVHNNFLIINAVPAVMEDESIIETINDILEKLVYQNVEKGEIAHQMIASIAKGSAKNKSQLNGNEAYSSLVDQLFSCENHTFTPGGKQIMHLFTWEEYLKTFE